MSEDIWKDDLLNRRADAELMISFLHDRTAERIHDDSAGSYVINLNSSWGGGKTFFLTRLHRTLSESGYISAYVNGWRDDAAGEPLIAVMAAIESALKPHFLVSTTSRKLWKTVKVSGGKAVAAIAKGAANKLVARFVGEGLSEALDIMQSKPDEEPNISTEPTIADAIGDAVGDNVGSLLNDYISAQIDQYQARINSSDDFKHKIHKMIAHLNEKGVPLPLYILIDELDRCRPTYAIETLEQVKHLFDVNGLAFVVATDSNQLSESIKAVYGSGFDAGLYLNRFFNRQYHFQTPSMLEICKFLFSSTRIDTKKLSTPPDVDHHTFFAQAMQFYGCGPRDTMQCFDILRSMVTTWKELVPIEMLYALPLIVSFHQANWATFESFEKLEMVIIQRSGPAWSIGGASAGNRDQIDTPKPANVMDLLQNMLNYAKMSLPEATGQSPGGSRFSHWVWSRFANEMSVRFQSQPQNGAKPMTLLRSYGERIRGLGRFTKEG